MREHESGVTGPASGMTAASPDARVRSMPEPELGAVVVSIRSRGAAELPDRFVVDGGASSDRFELASDDQFEPASGVNTPAPGMPEPLSSPSNVVM